MSKFVYSFNEGTKDMRTLLGGKGANLAEMTNIGLPVPFGFTITTEVCKKFTEDGFIDDAVIEEIWQHIEDMEEVTGKKFGDSSNPLLVSVRPGAPVSMPGMMSTILNLGLNDEATEALANLTGSPKFAYDSYRRFIQSYGYVVMGIRRGRFDRIYRAKKRKAGIINEIDFTAEDLKEVVEEYKELIRSEFGKEFPQDPSQQLKDAIASVFRSWNYDRAIYYRRLNGISDSLGTAVNVQAMVFGNYGDNSCTGVAFTRNPASGENKLLGEYLINAQGEDIVAGTRTPRQISEMAESFPDALERVEKIASTLETHYKDMQNIEFTVEEGKLFILQTRVGKRTAAAAVKISVDFVEEGLIDEETAVMRIDPEQITQLLHPTFDNDELAKATPACKGLPASPGAATGIIVFSAEDAVEASSRGINSVLVREETSPEDLTGMVASEGVLTARGGMTSYAAVIARGIGRCCITGCKEISVDESAKTLTIGDNVYTEGDSISLNGSDGSVYIGSIKTVTATLSGDFMQLMKWADEYRVLKVRTNADNSWDAALGLAFGAEGIGLCRTEHMFYDDDRLPKIRQMILADTEDERREALDALLTYQREDFKAIYKVMGDMRVTIRMLDPSLHEFLPKNEEDIRQLAEQMDKPYEKVLAKTMELHEVNPMFGERGSRLAIECPEIIEMQTEAIIGAALELVAEGQDITPEIMLPLIGHVNELKYVKNIIVKVADRLIAESGLSMKYSIGTMIEVPRAAVTADEIAEEAEFFSFGTNDLTQMGFGLSIDDTGHIIKDYVDKGILEDDPFKTIDRSGIGKLMIMASEYGRKTRPNIKLGICGEHGGDPESVKFFHEIGLNYVSCSAFRVPVARLAAAQAAIRDKKNKQ